MKIKSILYSLSLILGTASCAPKYVQVLDAETKKPIEGARCSFSFKGGNPFTPSYGSKRATSNKNGKAWATIPVGPLVSFQGITAEKIGYYSGRRSKDPAYEGKILLRPVKKTVDVRDFRFELRRNYDLDSTLKYDLFIGDWLPPRGKGEIADFEYSIDYEKYVDNNNYEVFLTLNFTNPRSGIYYYLNTEYRDSYFKFPYEAYKEGYTKKLTLFKKSFLAKDGSRVIREMSPVWDTSVKWPGLYIFKIYRGNNFFLGNYIPSQFRFFSDENNKKWFTLVSRGQQSLEPNSLSLEFFGKDFVEGQRKGEARRKLNEEREKRQR